jgi:macrolide-specific efflux system membrane fusion protein
LPSMTAQVFFVVEQARDVLRVPAATVAGGQVWLQQGSGELVERKIEVGISNRIYTEVRDGLADGDLVVTGGAPSRQAASSGMGGSSR